MVEENGRDNIKKEELGLSLSLSSKLGFPKEGFGANPKLEIPLTSYHITSSSNAKFNQFDPKNDKYLSNLGIGISVDSGVSLMGSSVRLEAATYKNSFYKQTTYVAAEWKPLNLDLPGGLKASFGVIAGVATGYKGHVDPRLEMGAFVPIIAPRISVGNETVSLNASFIPGATSSNGSGASAFAISASLKF